MSFLKTLMDRYVEDKNFDTDIYDLLVKAYMKELTERSVMKIPGDNPHCHCKNDHKASNQPAQYH